MILFFLNIYIVVFHNRIKEINSKTEVIEDIEDIINLIITTIIVIKRNFNYFKMRHFRKHFIIVIASVEMPISYKEYFNFIQNFMGNFDFVKIKCFLSFIICLQCLYNTDFMHLDLNN